MPVVLTNALLVDLDPPRVERGSLVIQGNRITARGNVTLGRGDELIDCAGAVVMPGMVNGHTHLYSALAVGMPPPPRQPKSFMMILEQIWWRLDRALDPESIEASGRIGALDAVRCGTTTLIDHHASPYCIDDSLDLIERGIDSVGLRGVLCYETTDRNGGRAGGLAGIAENRRYLKKCASHRNGRFAGLVGAHASFTLFDESLDALAALASEFKTGVHIHVAEDPIDEKICRGDFKIALIDRLDKHGILKPDSIFAHGTHLDWVAVEAVNAIGVTMAHNPRSNMNNSVGYAPVAKFKQPPMLGTDGIGADMFTEAKHAWFKSCDAKAGMTPQQIMGMLGASARRASAALGVTLGRLDVGAAADVVITDYVPFTELNAQNLAGHVIFAMNSQQVRHVLADGKWVLRDREVTTCDEGKVRSQTVAVAKRMWDRMAGIK